MSVSSQNDEGADASNQASISADGNTVAYRSVAPNLVADDTNGVRDIFIYTIDSRETRRVSLSSTGIQADDSSLFPVLSASGRIIIFESNAGNLANSADNGYTDIFFMIL